MVYGKYTFQCIFKEDAQLPPFKGSTLRGAFGDALKELVCTLKRQNCRVCFLNKKCLYVAVFETDLLTPPPGFILSAPPHPMVIEPPMSTQSFFAGGSAFEFHIILFGQANDFLPYIVHAVNCMGYRGIGKQIKGKRSRFTLTKVSMDSGVLYSDKGTQLAMPKTWDTLDLNRSEKEDRNTQTVTIIIETPLRFKSKDRLAADLPFDTFTRVMLRRASTLLTYYGENPHLDYQGLIKSAQSIQTIANELQWFEWTRYSNRQKQSMKFGGLTGSVTYRGDLGEYMPLIRFCRQVHVGKNTIFGLGKFKAVALQG